MRIAMVSPLEIRVPPYGYGGTELVVSLLTEELVRRGHDVTLYASGDSRTAARLRAGSERFLRGTNRNKAVLNMLNVVSCMKRAGEYDIVHNHTSLEGVALAGLIKTPVLTTFHGHLEGDWRLLFSKYEGWYNTISRSAKSLLPEMPRFAGVVHNAIDVAQFPFNPGPREDFLLFLSRISHEKGTHLAIRVARESGRRLVIAGNVNDTDRTYFEEEVIPHLDGDRIRYVGEADFAMKTDLMSRGACLLAPITWDEPFGLFLIEAMACGTPVIAFKRGAIPEVIADGITGFTVDTVDEMVESVERAGEIDPYDCRARVESRFDYPRMVDEYEAAYSQVIAEHELEAGPLFGREEIELGDHPELSAV